jgi:hypothetical protein
MDIQVSLLFLFLACRGFCSLSSVEWWTAQIVKMTQPPPEACSCSQLFKSERECLMGLYFMGVPFVGVHLIGVHLMACLSWACLSWAINLRRC